MVPRVIGKLLRALPRAIDQLGFGALSAVLLPSQIQELDRLRALRKDFFENYDALRHENIERFTTPHWDSFNRGFEETFLPVPPLSFLRDAYLRSQMFVDERYLQEELPLLREHFSHDLHRRARESLVGFPRLFLLDGRCITSTNALHTLYHRARYERFSGQSVERTMNVIEWGGGYGMSAKLFMRDNPHGTYSIIDTPFFSCIQWLYLTAIFGDERVQLISDRTSKVEPNRINLVPVCFVEDVDLAADLFYSTWALDESSLIAQDLVVEGGWFGAERLLLATSPNPPSRGSDHEAAENDAAIANAARQAGASEIEIGFMPWSRYLFR